MNWTESRSPSTAVVERVAAHDGVDAADLPPLNEALDPDALNSIFGPTLGGEPRSGTEGKVTFQYTGYQVTVHTDGTVSLTE